MFADLKTKFLYTANVERWTEVMKYLLQYKYITFVFKSVFNCNSSLSVYGFYSTCFLEEGICSLFLEWFSFWFSESRAFS